MLLNDIVAAYEAAMKIHKEEFGTSREEKLAIRLYTDTISAIKELKQYRSIGTVEEIKSNIAELGRWHSNRLNNKIKNPFVNISTMICANCIHKDEYIEELEVEIEEYKKIGTPDECREAVAKQRAKNAEHDEEKDLDVMENNT